MDQNNVVKPVPARRIDGYLSRKAQELDLSALVYCESAFEFVGEGQPMRCHELWTFERSGHDPIGLGSNFGNAKLAVECLLRSGLPEGAEGKAFAMRAAQALDDAAILIRQLRDLNDYEHMRRDADKWLTNNGYELEE